MRHHLSTAGLAAAIALVFATAAQAAQLRTVGGIPTLTQTPRTAPANTNTPTNTATTPPAPTNFTNVDVRNQQTLAATAGTRSSGSTSSLGPLANNATSATATTGTGTTSGAGATGTGSSTGTGTGTSGTGTGNGIVIGTSAAGVPLVVSPGLSAGLNSDATVGLAANGTLNTASAANFGSAGSLASNDVLSGMPFNGNATTDPAADPRAFDRALLQVKIDRKRIGRNGQLLTTIAPRTNVDRSHQMPDDGPSPSLSGFNSTLTR